MVSEAAPGGPLQSGWEILNELWMFSGCLRDPSVYGLVEEEWKRGLGRWVGCGIFPYTIPLPHSGLFGVAGAGEGKGPSSPSPALLLLPPTPRMISAAVSGGQGCNPPTPSQ